MVSVVVIVTLLLTGPIKAGPVAQNQAWVFVSEEGKRPWGRFLPGMEPYEPGCGPGVGSREVGLKTAQGEPIDSLDLVGWKDGDAYRIAVYAVLVGAPGQASSGECGGSRRQREIGSVHVRAGEEAMLEPMKAIGARPWRVAVVLR